MENTLIPQHIEGKQLDLDHAVSCANDADAHDLFRLACNRMLAPGSWHDLCGPLSAEFTLLAPNGHEAKRPAKEGDYFRVNIPGPGSQNGDGYDWVRVEAVECTPLPGEDETCGIRLRPCGNPQNEETDTAHFFQGSATSTFIIHRQGSTVTATHHGRNEVPNVNTDNTMDNVRNAMITSGAMAGLSKMQWGALIKAFVA